MYELPTGGIGQRVSLDYAPVQVPTEIQSHLTKTIQTHNAVSVPASGNSNSAFYSCDGYDKLCISLNNDSATSSVVSVEWSYDGTNAQGADSGVIPNNTTQRKSGVTDVKAPYFRVVAGNTDGALAHTMSIWAYLKA